MNEALRTVLVGISGRVQGVWFRDWTKKKADALGLVGWVRNKPDRSVEARFTGPADLVDEMIDNCRRGPLLASVDEVIVTPCEIAADDLSSGFQIRY